MSQGGDAQAGLASMVEEQKPETSLAYRQILYTHDLCWVMYAQVGSSQYYIKVAVDLSTYRAFGTLRQES